MLRAENKAERLLKMEMLLLSHPEGLTQAEMARHLGVNRSTVNRNLCDFQKIYPTIVYDNGRISLDRSAYLLNVAFTLHEAMSVHLAARLMATRMDKHNPHAASALRKLSVALEKLAPRISTHVKQSADVMEEADQRQDLRYLEVLEKLTLAWTEQKKTRIWHRSEKTRRVFEYLFSTYFIELYAVGQTTYVIGRDDCTGKMRTMKIERIERVELTMEHYEIPAAFDARVLLSNAWGIWYTETEPVEVTIKFHSRVARRVLETRWHRSASEIELPDGSLLWKAKVAEPQEMLPWIRGWGADCEVLEPKELREALMKEARRLARAYGVMNIHAPHTHFFAHCRDGKDREDWQLLIDHLRKTAEMARDFDADANVAELAYIAGLVHDLGKYAAEFQKRLKGGPRVDHSTAGAKELKKTAQRSATGGLCSTIGVSHSEASHGLARLRQRNRPGRRHGLRAAEKPHPRLQRLQKRTGYFGFTLPTAFAHPSPASTHPSPKAAQRLFGVFALFPDAHDLLGAGGCRLSRNRNLHERRQAARRA